jgi:Uma2 family endonuclease
MSAPSQPQRTWPKPGEVFYPESNGLLLADNTEQFNWIVLLVENLKSLFAQEPNVFVAGDLLWYPVEGRVDIAFAPDVMVVFGRPMGYRGCYKQWEEDGIGPQVVCEILSPNNTAAEMIDKFNAYARYGVEEYYLYDPERKVLQAWVRESGGLRPVAGVEGFRSPRLRVRFWPARDGLKIERPDGTAFESHLDLVRRSADERRRADKEKKRADQERARAERERARAEQERIRAEQERIRAEQERAWAERLAARLRSLGLGGE